MRYTVSKTCILVLRNNILEIALHEKLDLLVFANVANI